MADLVRVRFVKPFGAYPAGHEEAFLPEAVARYGDALELLDPPATATAGSVEYDGSLLAKMEQSLSDLRAERDSLDGRLAAERQKTAKLEARVSELQAIVDSYTGAATTTAQPTPAAEPVATTLPVPEPAVSEPAPAEAGPVPAAAAVEDDAALAPPPAAPTVAAAPAAAAPAWRSTPTAALGIPAGLKGTLLTAGFKTAGEVSDGIADGRVQLLPGVGEAKVEQLRQHLAALAAS